MKRILLICWLSFVSAAAFAQKKTLAQWNFQSEIRLNQNDYTINNTLNAAQIQIGKTSGVPGSVGLEYFLKDFSAEVALGLGINTSSNEEFGYRLNSLVTTVQLKYNFEDLNMSIGLSGRYEQAGLALFAQGASIDIASNIHSSFVELNNSFLYLGPAVAYEQWINEGFNFRAVIGYHLGISTHTWSSNYGRMAEAITEQRNNQFYVSVGFPLKRIMANRK